MHPTHQRRNERKVLRFKPVVTRTEHVCDLSLMYEYRGLPGAHDELCAVLDLVSVARKSPYESVLRIIDPLNNIN